MSMKTTSSLALVLVLSLSGACSNDRPAQTASDGARPSSVADTGAANALRTEEMSPEELGELGARIEKTPDRAKELLAEKKLDEKSFEQQIRKVTENPDASKRYAEAYKKAKG
jgi:hypothetical protein